MNYIETKEMHFFYEKNVEVLKNINIKIEKGTFTALLGANGCGKSTLMQLLTGLLKPTRGNIFLNGQDMKKLSDDKIFSNIGIVFQNPDDQLFSFTVSEDVAYGVDNLGIKGEEQKKRVMEALRLVGIEDLKDKEIHKLSYGQKKRVAIAGVLAMQPDLLILDEPTAGLDPMTSSNLITLLEDMQKNKGFTVLISTHEVDIVPVCCDRVFVMNKGEIVLEGSPEKVFDCKEILRESNLRLPRIGHLMEILREKDNLPLEPYKMTISGARKAINDLIGKIMKNKSE